MRNLCIATLLAWRAHSMKLMNITLRLRRDNDAARESFLRDARFF